MLIWASLPARTVASETVIELAILKDSEAHRKTDEQGSA
jgi:hypothetical protein